MSREFIAKALKRLREDQGLTADQVGAMIGKSGKTVNAWENNRGQPDAEMLMLLCKIYKVENILKEFQEYPDDEINPKFTISEQEMIKKYRVLDGHGKEIVDFVLEKEAERVAEEAAPQAKMYHIKIAGFDGSFEEKDITEEEADAIRNLPEFTEKI